MESPQVAAYVFYELADRGGFHNDRARREELFAGLSPSDREVAANALEPWAKLYPPPRSDQTIRVAEELQSAKLVRSEPAAGLQGKSGDVVLKALIAVNGTVESLELQSGDSALAESAMASVKRWVYKPTFVRGVRVKVLTTITVTFPIGSAANK